VPRSFVVDASPLILLARVQRLDLLATVANTVLIPEAVLKEVDAGNEKDGAGVAVRQIRQFQIVPDLQMSEQIQLWDLGVGESQVLSYARERPGLEAIVDDLAARRCAQSIQIPVLGTLGLVLTCRQLDLIPAARPLLIELHRAGMRVKTSILDQALAKVGESAVSE